MVRPKLLDGCVILRLSLTWRRFVETGIKGAYLVTLERADVVDGGHELAARSRMCPYAVEKPV
jgi:hypothetical protein